MNKSKLIPSMFHRRLLLLMGCVVAFVMVLVIQMFRVSIVQGSTRLSEAESKLDSREYLATYRGRILDRHGRVLALDRASYDIAVDYSVITGDWIRIQATAQARSQLGRSQWSSMSPEDRVAATRSEERRA